MFGHTRNTVCEIVEEPHHKGVRPFRLGAVSKMLGLLKLTPGDHVRSPLDAASTRAARFRARLDVISTPFWSSPTSSTMR